MNADAERRVICSAMLHGSLAMPAAARLLPEHFAGKHHAAIWGALLALYTNTGDVDVVRLREVMLTRGESAEVFAYAIDVMESSQFDPSEWDFGADVLRVLEAAKARA